MQTPALTTFQDPVSRPLLTPMGIDLQPQANVQRNKPHGRRRYAPPSDMHSDHTDYRQTSPRSKYVMLIFVD